MKANFIRQMQTDAAQLAQLVAAVRDRKNTYTDRGYHSGGDDPITDQDILDATGNDTLTAADFAPTGDGFAALLLQLINLVDGNAVVTASYGATLNKVRNDV